MKIKTVSLVLGISTIASSVQATDRAALNNSNLEQDVFYKTVMPGGSIVFDIPDGNTIENEGVEIRDEWTAPRTSGNHNLVIKNADGVIVGQLTVFVLEPSSSIDKRGFLGTYRIGTYPKNTPPGFIKLEEHEVDLAVSRNFKVGQFLCKQQPDVWPKYVLVSHENLTRLETVLAKLLQEGKTDADTLFVMSGFRTPYYNKAIGSAKYSRHMYGDAADVYLDDFPADGNMDDVNGDGHINKADANYLYDYAEKIYANADVVTGGIGAYKANSAHGPFVHIDARGRKARWGRWD